MPPEKRNTPPSLRSSSDLESSPPQPPQTPPDEPDEVPCCPACPGVVKTRAPAKQLKETDAFQMFNSLMTDQSLSLEEAFLKLITSYDISRPSFAEIIPQKLDVSFSKVKFQQVAPYVGLEPDGFGRDIKPLAVFRSRIPRRLFNQITENVSDALIQYGPLFEHDNEEIRSRFIVSLFSKIVCLFDGIVINKAECLLESNICRKGRIEHQFYALGSLSVLFLEVERLCVLGRDGLDVKGQVLAECAACDFTNKEAGLWTPILAVLCDGNNFMLFVYDSVDQIVYCSGWLDGVPTSQYTAEAFHLKIKYVAELFLDWFIMAYLNGLRAFAARSASRSLTRKRVSLDRWEAAVKVAERGRAYLRAADTEAAAKNWTEAEDLACRGIELLRESIGELPRTVQPQRLLDLSNSSQCLEQVVDERVKSGTVRMY